MHDNTLSQDNRDKFSWIVGRYNQQIKFYNVEQTCADEIETIKNLFPRNLFERFSVAAMFRLLIPKIISEDKVIYLDSDIIVNMDINKLWRIDLEDKPLAAVTTFENENAKDSQLGKDGFVQVEDYFNSGVLLMNLDRLRMEEKNILAGIKFIAENPKYNSTFDQEILNYCLSSRSMKLPKKFNCAVRMNRSLGIKKIERNIYHYLGAEGGFGLNMADKYNKLFMKYFIQTPFFNEETIGRMYEGLIQIYVDRQSFATYVSAMMSGKTRAFFISPPMLEGVKNVFGVRADEEIILAENNESLGRLINSANNKVFFISPDIYQQCREILIQAGLVENRDFINIINFLSDAHGVPLNSYQLIKLL